MKNKQTLTLLAACFFLMALMSACKKEEPIVDQGPQGCPTEYYAVPPVIPLKELMGMRLAEERARLGRETLTQRDTARVYCRIASQEWAIGTTNPSTNTNYWTWSMLDSARICYGRTLGMSEFICGDNASAFTAMMTETTSMPVSQLSTGTPSGGDQGHVIACVEFVENGDTVWAVYDAQYNTEWQGRDGSAYDLRAMYLNKENPGLWTAHEFKTEGVNYITWKQCVNPERCQNAMEDPRMYFFAQDTNLQVMVGKKSFCHGLECIEEMYATYDTINDFYFKNDAARASLEMQIERFRTVKRLAAENGFRDRTPKGIYDVLPACTRYPIHVGYGGTPRLINAQFSERINEFIRSH